MAIIIERIVLSTFYRKLLKRSLKKNKIKNEILLLATNEPNITKIKTNGNQNFFLYLKKIKSAPDKEKINIFWRYAPAIASCSKFVILPSYGSYPKIFFPNKNCTIKSIAKKIITKRHILKKKLRLIFLL